MSRRKTESTDDASPESNHNGVEEFEASGAAQFSMESSRRQAPAAYEAEETLEEKSSRNIERDLVWPGKEERFRVVNPENVEYRFNFSITDLEPALYVILPPVGGVMHPDGGVVLKPDEDARFTIRFVHSGGDTPPMRNCNVVLTMFDIRRAADAGEILNVTPLRWAPLPTPSDLQLSVEPVEIVTRWWSRPPSFHLQFENKSHLPPGVELKVIRAATRDGLEEEGEQVGAIKHALQPRTSVTWRCALPKRKDRASYYATAVGKAVFADRGRAQASSGRDIEIPVRAAKPAFVKYVPFGSLWQDWAFAVAALLLLFWIVWGIPAQKTPVVRITLQFVGTPPDVDKLKKLKLTLTPLEEGGSPVPGALPIAGVYKQAHGYYEFTLPSRWYGYQFGWNIFSRKPQQMELDVTPGDDAKADFAGYHLDKLGDSDNWLTISPAGDTSGSDKAPFYRDWIIKKTYPVIMRHGVPIRVFLENLTAPGGSPPADIDVTFGVPGKESSMKNLPIQKDAAGRRYVDYDVSGGVVDGDSAELMVSAKTPTATSLPTGAQNVHHADKPFIFDLKFTQTPTPGSSLNPPGLPVTPGLNAPAPPPSSSPSAPFTPPGPGANAALPGAPNPSFSPIGADDKQPPQNNPADVAKHDAPKVHKSEHNQKPPVQHLSGAEGGGDAYTNLINRQWDKALALTSASRSPADMAIWAIASYERHGTDGAADAKVASALAATDGGDRNSRDRQLAVIADAYRLYTIYKMRSNDDGLGLRRLQQCEQAFENAKSNNSADSLALWYVGAAEVWSHDTGKDADELLEKAKAAHSGWSGALQQTQNFINN